jgi:hypothetical protein
MIRCGIGKIGQKIGQSLSVWTEAAGSVQFKWFRRIGSV